MADRIPSDHATVTTHRARIVRSGGTRRPCLRLPAGVGLDGGELFRLVLDGNEYHARAVADHAGLVVRGAYDNRRLARAPEEADNRLVEWVEATGRTPESSVEFDEVESGDLYGLRVPGRRAVYRVTRRPNDSLASIAEKLTRSEDE